MTSVSSAASAIDVLRAASPGELAHVIVSDIAMADEDGYAFIRQVRALSPDRGGRIPALSVTGYASSDDVRHALAAGFQMHLVKPVDPDALVEAVATLAGKARMRAREDAWSDVKP
ncbi:MAG: response regulator [Vicinamibacterales bacterium]